jgi:restriction system protein
MSLIVLSLVSIGLLAIVAWYTWRQRTGPTAFIDVDAVRKLSWGELEILISDYFVREGFVPRGGGKLVDLVLEKNGRRYFVQCKHWRNRKIDVPEVKELFGHMAAANATGAWLVGSGSFTPAAVRFASGKRIELVDGKGLVKMVEDVQRDPSEITQSRLDAMQDAEQTQPRRVILCPRCGRPMAKRRERANARREFYGCSRYPTCKGRREIA